MSCFILLRFLPRDLANEIGAFLLPDKRYITACYILVLKDIQLLSFYKNIRYSGSSMSFYDFRQILRLVKTHNKSEFRLII